MLLNRIRYYFSKDKQFITRLRKVTGFFPSNIALYKTAFTHRSILGNNAKPHEYNDRLEYLGDSVLGIVIAEFLYEQFPEEDEGTLTKIKSAMVSRKTLNGIADSLELKFLVKAKINQENFPLSLGGNALEALIGAIYLDRGLNAARNFVHQKMLVPFYNMQEIKDTDHNFKSKLIEWSQKNKVPVYFKVLDEGVEEHNKLFHIGLFIEDEMKEEAMGKSKKEAEQSAAKKLFLSGFIDTWQSSL